MKPEDLNDLPMTTGQEIANSKREIERNSDLLGQLLDHVSSNNYIPWEKVQLPSNGIYYGDKMPDGYLEVKPMGVDVDKMLTNQRLAQSGELLNKIVESCTRFPPDMDVRELLAGDFNFLLYYLRGITHGPVYEFVSDCPFCKTKNVYEFDLTELYSTVKKNNPNYPEEPMSILLPKLSETFGKEVYALLRLVRVDDIMKMSQPGNDQIFDPVKHGQVRLRGKNKHKTTIKNDIDDTSKIYENSMKRQVVGFEIDNVKFTDSRKLQLIEKLHQQDTSTIREFIDDISPGIDTSLEVVCNNTECGKESTISLPWNENFFRPVKGG